MYIVSKTNNQVKIFATNSENTLNNSHTENLTEHPRSSKKKQTKTYFITLETFLKLSNKKYYDNNALFQFKPLKIYSYLNTRKQDRELIFY